MTVKHDTKMVMHEVIEYAESCPFFEENTVADVCDRCLEESKGVRI